MTVTTPPQRPMRTAAANQQIWTVWTMLLWFMNSVYDPQIAQLLSDFANAKQIQSGSVSMTSLQQLITHGLNMPYSVVLTPTSQLQVNAGSITVPSQTVKDDGLWGPDDVTMPAQNVGFPVPSAQYWAAGKANKQFYLQLSSAVVIGNPTFDWMVIQQ